MTVIGRYSHARIMAAGPEQTVRSGKIVAWHAHEQMMFAVIIDPIRCNGHARDEAGIGGSGVGKRVTAASWCARMFGDVPDAQEQLEGRSKCDQP